MIANRNQNGPNGKLDFADILSYDDREIYNQLQTEVSDSQNRYNRNHKVQTLNNILEKVLSFCERNENDKWKRYLACGICKFGDYLAINNKQFGSFISKSKSAINDSLSKMGYVSVSNKRNASFLLIEKIPFLFGNYPELRKWTIRTLNLGQVNSKTESNIDEINKQNILIIDDNQNKETEDFNEELIFNDNLINNVDSFISETEDQFNFVNSFGNTDDCFDFDFDFCCNDENNECLSGFCSSSNICGENQIKKTGEDSTKVF